MKLDLEDAVRTFEGMLGWQLQKLPEVSRDDRDDRFVCLSVECSFSGKCLTKSS